MSKIFGLAVVLPDQCRNCNSNTAFVGDAPPPHFTQLICDGCECGSSAGQQSQSFCAPAKCVSLSSQAVMLHN